MDNPETNVPCPYCKEPIMRGAIKCRHCQSEIKGGAMLQSEYAVAGALSEPQQQQLQTKPSAFRAFFRSTNAVIIKTFQFSGRSSRSEFWYFILACGLFGVLVIDIALAPILSERALKLVDMIFSAIVTVPQLSVSVRRLHDIGRRGAWLLFAFTIIGFVPLIYWLTRPSQPGPNAFGGEPHNYRVQNTCTPEQSNRKPNSRKGGFVAVVLLGILVVSALVVIGQVSGASSSDLQAKRYNYNRVELMNVGRKPITIKKVAFNERDECSLTGDMAELLILPKLPATLNVGDVASVGSACVVVRVNVDTAEGAFSYSFE